MSREDYDRALFLVPRDAVDIVLFRLAYFRPASTLISAAVTGKIDVREHAA